MWQTFSRNIQIVKKRIHLLPTLNIRGERGMTEQEADLWLYNEMDAEGKRAWRKLFGLPELLKKGGNTTEIGEDSQKED